MKILSLFITALAVVLFGAGPPAARSQAPAPAAPAPATPAANPWTAAEAAMAAHLKGIDPAMRSGEFASNLLRQYLPDLRVFVRFDRHLSGETRIFLINKAGDITPLRDEEWRSDAAAKYFGVPSVMAFLKTRKIKITSEAQAIEVARLYEELAGAANYVAFLHINTSEFKVFDKAFFEAHLSPRTDWKHIAAPGPGGKGWTVTVTYTGPPASITAPPIYSLTTDESGAFTELRRYHEVRDVPK